MVKNMKSVLVLWIIVMSIVTFTCSLVYLITQQSLRLGANEPLAQLAIETSIKLQNGQSIQDVVPAEKVDVSKSLSAFVMVFEKVEGNLGLMQSSGIIGDRIPVYPMGVLDSIGASGEARVTWQTKEGLRFATVAIKSGDGYVVAARSLSETERLIAKLGQLILLAWLAYTVFSVFAFGAIYFFLKRLS